MSSTWTGSTITAVGTVNYPGGTVSVGGASGTIYPDKTFDAAGVPVHLGVNCLTNVFTDIFGRSVTNTTSFTITNRTYIHDANGNLTSDGVFQYQYDAANQLTNVVRTADGARVLSARYDALGRRVEATRADGSVERYVYFPCLFCRFSFPDAWKGQCPRSGVQWGQCAKSSWESSTRREARAVARQHLKCEIAGKRHSSASLHLGVRLVLARCAENAIPRAQSLRRVQRCKSAKRTQPGWGFG